MGKQSKSAPWWSMRPGPGPKVAVAAAEVVATAAADMVVVAVDMVTDAVAAAVDTVTSAAEGEIAADGAADAPVIRRFWLSGH
jgi:hypothetical protein